MYWRFCAKGVWIGRIPQKFFCFDFISLCFLSKMMTTLLSPPQEGGFLMARWTQFFSPLVATSRYNTSQHLKSWRLP